MRKFIIPDAGPFAEVEPLPESVKRKEIVSIPRNGDVDELHGGTFSSDGCIQRRSEDRRQHHIYTIAHSSFHKSLDRTPIRFAEDIKTVIGGKAVGVQPLREFQSLLRQSCVQNSEQKCFGCCFVSSAIEKQNGMSVTRRAG